MPRLTRVTATGLTLLGLCVGSSSAQAQVVEYAHLDAIGNVRAVTDQNGVVIERHDYLPFGEECLTGPCASNPNAGAGQPRKFTGKERDTETGLDYFGARYYRADVGRFTTVDPAYNWNENLLDPQRWNRYAYGRGNPHRYVDPDGKDVWDIVSGGANAFGSNFLLTAGRVGARNSDFEFGQALGDLASIPAGYAWGSYGAGVAGVGVFGTAGTGGVAAPVSVPVAVAGSAITVQGGVATISGEVRLGIYLAKKLKDAGDKARFKKDRSLEGAQDQLDGIENEQAGQRKAGRDKIDSTKKSEQDLRKELRKIKSAEDLKSGE